MLDVLKLLFNCETQFLKEINYVRVKRMQAITQTFCTEFLECIETFTFLYLREFIEILHPEKNGLSWHVKAVYP